MAREVGTEGKLGGQARCRASAGTWKDLTDNVNSMAGNLTAQVRNIAEVATAVANGDLSRKITVDVKGEILAAERNHQHDGRPAAVLRLGSHPRGARSRHRRQARRPGAGPRRRAARGRTSPTTSTQMAGNLTAQVRNIAEVTIAVANGDLSKKITVDVRGEILQLKETINTMVDQLRSSPRKSPAWRAKSAPKASSAARRRSPAWRHVEGPDRQRQLDGRQPDRPGAQHRRRDHRRRQRRPVAARSRST